MTYSEVCIYLTLHCIFKDVHVKVLTRNLIYVFIITDIQAVQSKYPLATANKARFITNDLHMETDCLDTGGGGWWYQSGVTWTVLTGKCSMRKSLLNSVHWKQQAWWLEDIKVKQLNLKNLSKTDTCIINISYIYVV